MIFLIEVDFVHRYTPIASTRRIETVKSVVKLLIMLEAGPRWTQRLPFRRYCSIQNLKLFQDVASFRKHFSFRWLRLQCY
jgi:hypothetical protein